MRIFLIRPCDSQGKQGETVSTFYVTLVAFVQCVTLNMNMPVTTYLRNFWVY